MLSNTIIRLGFILSIASVLYSYIAQAKAINGHGEIVKGKSYWTIHLLKLKPGTVSLDCNAVLVKSRQNETVQTSQLLLTTVYFLEQRDKMRRINETIVNEKEISALFIERNSDGQFMSYFEMGVESIAFHEGYEIGSVDHEANIMALIKLKDAVQVRETLTPIFISEIPISNVSRCFVAGQLLSYDRIQKYPRKWNFKDSDEYLETSLLKENFTLADVEPHLRDETIEIIILKSVDPLLQLNLGSPLICRQNEVDVVQGVIVWMHYKNPQLKNNTELLLSDVHRFSSWIAETSEKMMQ